MGGPGDGPLVLGIDGSTLFQCLLVIKEPGFGWTKPAGFANWASELSVSVNGKQCDGSSCVLKGHNSAGSSLWIDARRRHRT